MTTWVAVTLVAAVSVGLRIGPQFVPLLANPPAALDRVVRHAGTAALVAMIASAVAGGGSGRLAGWPIVLAVAVGATLAVRGRSMLTIVVAGMTAGWLTLAATTLLS